MGARKTKHHPILFAKIVKVDVVVFGSVVTLKGFNFAFKLSRDKGGELGKNAVHIGLADEGVSPQKICVVI